jgi:hypothetical protein
MPVITIKYSNSKTLNMLKDISKYFDYEISTHVKKIRRKRDLDTNDYIVPADNTIDISDLFKIFLGKKINAKELRAKAWQRK